MADIVLTNPATGAELDCRDYDPPDRVEAALAGLEHTFGAWRRQSPEQRAAALAGAADRLETESEAAAAEITATMGKPVTQARGEVEKCVGLLRYYAEHTPQLVRPQVVGSEARQSEVRLQPLGVVLGIMPWNYPLWQVVRWAVPTLAAGNVCLLKHADNVQPSARRIASVMAAAGEAAGVGPVLASVCCDVETTGDLIDDRRVRGVSLTGSERAGRSVAARAGAAVKPSLLELGGSDAAVVLPGCDLDRHLDTLVTARFQNTGQTCIAAKRYLVHRDIENDFRERFVHAAMELTVGDPADGATRLGPLARADLRDTLHEQVEQTVVEGARLLIGGQRLELDGELHGGFFYEPTVLDQVQPGMTPFREELFGPAASIIVGRDDSELLAMANAVDYGLSATVWTDDLDRAAPFVDGLQAGAVFVNQLAKSDWRLPFGGMKNSGYGRELGGRGVEAFANLKTVWIA